MKKLPYKVGDVFGIPLDTGGFALGVIARMAPKGKLLLGYFFGIVYQQMPAIGQIPELKKEDAVFVAIFGDLGLIKGYWTIIGPMTPWVVDDWPMPLFIRKDVISNEGLLVKYADDNPSLVVEETSLGHLYPHNLPEDGIYGYGAIEEKMTELLCGG